MTTPDNKALLQLQVDAGIPHTPTPLTYELRLAVSGEGPRAYDWSDKPHRLLYDACSEIERNAGQVTVLEEENARLLEALEGMLYAVCHETGFAAAVRHDSGKAYPWAPLEIAEERARAVIAAAKGA